MASMLTSLSARSGPEGCACPRRWLGTNCEPETKSLSLERMVFLTYLHDELLHRHWRLHWRLRGQAEAGALYARGARVGGRAHEGRRWTPARRCQSNALQHNTSMVQV
eukprot:5029312-Pyramimonas_sp.AAC.1